MNNLYVEKTMDDFDKEKSELILKILSGLPANKIAPIITDVIMRICDELFDNPQLAITQLFMGIKESHKRSHEKPS